MVENAMVTEERKLFSILLKIEKKYIPKYLFSPYSDDEETLYKITFLL